jgi:hypothetical protein
MLFLHSRYMLRRNKYPCINLFYAYNNYMFNRKEKKDD